ncbi:MAG TPA: IS1182 family transposase [Bryobacteraceae bacterium]|nr:IS1182 family transposase [Bryobacteraceae bacterium]
MSKRFRTCNLHQPFLLPPSLQEWLPEDHLARFLAEAVERLDLSAIYAWYGRKDGRGAEAYHPVLMVRLLLYGYCTGRVSSRQMERLTHEDVAFRYLAANQHPDHDTIATFRKEHGEALAGLFGETLGLCPQAGLVKAGAVILDGTKVAANASRRQSHDEPGLAREQKRLAEIARRLLEQAEQTDAEEDARYGKGKRGDELPEELATVERRRKKLDEAQAELKRQAQERAEQAERERAAKKAAGQPQSEAEKKRWSRAKKAMRENKAQYNLTDPDSQLMRDSRTGGLVQGYNAQAAVLDNQIIVAAEVSSQATDKQQLVPMAAKVENSLGGKPDVMLADAGYWSEEAVTDSCWEAVNLLVSPDRGKPDEALKKNSPRSAAAVAMREKLRSQAGARWYRLRKQTVEPVFGQIKQGRGFRRFLLRGREQVAAEWKLICTGHNLWKMFRAGGMRLLAAPAPG